MPSLWGLLGDRFEDTGQNFDDGRYTRRGYRLLPRDLTDRIEELWGTAVLPRWPQALVTEPYPHAAFADAFGPGVDFWHGVALTCWFICEGPYSRSDVAGMPSYYERQIKALDDLGCPIDDGIFADLRQAETMLKDRPPPPGDTTERDVGHGLTISITVSMGPPRKDGFEHLRDVVTRHRRTWSEQYLERYLQARWEQDLRAAGDAYHRHVADKGKSPTLKQFAKLAEHTADRWFGGDLAQLYNALALPAPDPPTYHRLLPPDRSAFVARVRELLGGQRWEDSPDDMDRDERERRLRLSELADHAPAAVQTWEATGEPPPLRGVSWARYRLETAFGPDIEAGWQKFLTAVDAALHEPAPQRLTVLRAKRRNGTARGCAIATNTPPPLRPFRRGLRPHRTDGDCCHAGGASGGGSMRRKSSSASNSSGDPCARSSAALSILLECSPSLTLKASCIPSTR